jgi:hypothetical protein
MYASQWQAMRGFSRDPSVTKRLLLQAGANTLEQQAAAERAAQAALLRARLARSQS